MDFITIFCRLNLWEFLFCLFCAYRYIRLIVNTFAHWRYKSKPLPKDPSFVSTDATIIVPTIEQDVDKLRLPIRSILACNPAEIFLVTTTDKYEMLHEFVMSLKDARVKVYQTRIANKRLQLREAIPRVTSAITVLVDDDVTWPSTALHWILAPFEDGQIGSVGVCQRVRRLTEGSIISRCYNWLGADYIERRNFEISATHWMDGGTSCMSGRTNAIRTEILKDSKFLEGFCHEKWGTFNLNADDDNFVTRWLVNNNWKTYIQYNSECMIETTLENNHKFLLQCLRWARSNWRSNYTSLVVDRVVLRKQPWTVYAIYLATFTSLGLFTDPLFFFLYHMTSSTWSVENRMIGWFVVVVWYLFTKVIKRVGLLYRNPSDIVFIPVSILFGYFHGGIKIWALITWNFTQWGSRPDGDTNDDERMTPAILPSEVMQKPSADTKCLVRYANEPASESVSSLPEYKSESEHPPQYDSDDTVPYEEVDSHPMTPTTSTTMN